MQTDLLVEIVLLVAHFTELQLILSLLELLMVAYQKYTFFHIQ